MITGVDEDGLQVLLKCAPDSHLDMHNTWNAAKKKECAAPQIVVTPWDTQQTETPVQGAAAAAKYFFLRPAYDKHGRPVEAAVCCSQCGSELQKDGAVYMRCGKCGGVD